MDHVKYKAFIPYLYQFHFYWLVFLLKDQEDIKLLVSLIQLQLHMLNFITYIAIPLFLLVILRFHIEIEHKEQFTLSIDDLKHKQHAPICASKQSLLRI